MKFGLSPSSWEILDRIVFQPLLRSGAKVWIFGSRARGDQREYSDLDVLYRIPSPLPDGMLSRIREALEESKLPILVDLVSEADLADSYRAGAIRERVEIKP